LAGAYFVTICAHNRECLFGEIINGEMMLDDAGKMIERCWLEIPDYYQSVELDEFIMMPNHFHGIIVITDSVVAESISAHCCKTNSISQNRLDIESIPTKSLNTKIPWKGLTEIIQTFKRYTTIEYNKMVKMNIFLPFNKTVWQRNYYEHIICDESDLRRIRDCIVNNPARWQDDEENPFHL